jgi:hypothetical protein
MSNLKIRLKQNCGTDKSLKLSVTYFHCDEPSWFCDILIRKKLLGCCRDVDFPRLKAKRNNQLFAEKYKQDNFSEHR